MTGSKKIIKNILGYTLVELLVAMSLFSIATVYSVNIFAQSNRVQKRTANIQRVISDARYTLEIIAREVRMDEIDYNFYSPPLIDVYQEELALIDVNHDPIRFRRYKRSSDRYVVQFCKGESMCSAENYLDITPEDLSVETLAFYITPKNSPFALDSSASPADYYNDIQPLVTIVMKTKSIHEDLEGEKISNFQTTISPRKYFR